MKPFDLNLDNLRLTVPDGDELRTIFASSRFALPEGSLLGVRGESGSGKSTFLKLISGILTPTEGAVNWGETPLSRLPEGERDRWRGENCGFLFQDFRLFEDLSAEENVLLPATFYRRRTTESGPRSFSATTACAPEPVRCISREAKCREQRSLASSLPHRK